MIKLIATDLDGTLLDDQKNFPTEFPEIILKLKAHGIRVVIASGRQYFNIAKLFEPVLDDLYFLSDNGCIVYEGKNCLTYTELQQEHLLDALERVSTIPTAHAVLCGLKSTYVTSTNPFFLKTLQIFNERNTIVPDLHEVFQYDHICKLAIFDDEIKSETNLFPQMQDFSDRFNVALASREWLDCMPAGMSKGVGIRQLTEKLGLTPENVMAFGDYENDREMLEYSYHSYAMKNAFPDILKVARFTTEYSNNENGVIRTLKQVFDFL